MLCSRIDELSIKYIENQLDDLSKREFENHILNCNKCRDKYNEIKCNYDVSFNPASAIDLRLSIMNQIKAIKTPSKKVYKHKFKLTPLITEFAEVLVVVLVMFLIPVMVQQANQPKEVISSITISPEEFLIVNELKVQGSPEVLKVQVPMTWDVKLGDYPIGLYWRLANEFSRDAGLDLKPLKGKAVEVWRYSLIDGLPGEGEQSQFKYPSDLILLVDDKKVVGAWLNFNKWSIGPSIKKHSLLDISGLAYEEWIAGEGLFSSVGKNADIASLEPIDLLKAFFKAINEGDKDRANACLSPIELRSSLTVNLEKDHLYVSVKKLTPRLS